MRTERREGSLLLLFWSLMLGISILVTAQIVINVNRPADPAPRPEWCALNIGDGITTVEPQLDRATDALMQQIGRGVPPLVSAQSLDRQTVQLSLAMQCNGGN